ncbi:ankyrin repeat-containing domain protein [Podospora aff. communis PSN243]|uniref:Ankyrin repeat-containing domain protein n=1 Tax=Podospora aff. communis PSN243 TaxID=3040156 RepID=A0AAV9GYU8_9PEZI|nr:ankyrin repeat-containing domain protein [Podospora aff. communis PSN243]
MDQAHIGGIHQTKHLRDLQHNREAFARIKTFHDTSTNHSDLTYGLGCNLLYVVSFHNRQALVQGLIDLGVDVNAEGGYYGNALQAAAVAVGTFDFEPGPETKTVIQKLLGAGANVNAQGGHYGTALQAVAARAHHDNYEGAMEVIQILLCAGADVNAQSAATTSPSLKMVKLLLEAGADARIKGGSYHGNALLAAAAATSLYDDETPVFEVIKMLLDAGADVSDHGGHYGSALQAAITQRNGVAVDVVKMLLEASAASGPHDVQIDFDEAIEVGTCRGLRRREQHHAGLLNAFRVPEMRGMPGSTDGKRKLMARLEAEGWYSDRCLRYEEGDRRDRTHNCSGFGLDSGSGGDAEIGDR